jgi:hypothetical protein
MKFNRLAENIPVSENVTHAVKRAGTEGNAQKDQTRCGE